MFRQFSLGKIGLIVGTTLTIIGFIAYGQGNATLNLVGFLYGIPILLGGLALKTNELKPIPFSQPTTPAISKLRQQQATATQVKILQDITRYCYGQNAHLESTLNYLGLSVTDQEKTKINSLREINHNGSYALILEFDSPFIPIETWLQKQEKMTKFFGPGIQVEVTQPSKERIDLILMTLPE
ncbi:Cyanobacterial protein slr0575 [Richelia intracellularis HM01]|uniref:DUF2854 domain-containing protein n=1 Tax=Richelia intracellularis TaxID=1164990 RepID=UPI0002B52181|nr:DUF2854 domain-containing protein [Richelia intracellularis]CCH65159.1 Cyanobacterial protein slr0575 [Richelia intracellularis HM01]